MVKVVRAGEDGKGTLTTTKPVTERKKKTQNSNGLKVENCSGVLNIRLINEEIYAHRHAPHDTFSLNAFCYFSWQKILVKIHIRTISVNKEKNKKKNLKKRKNVCDLRVAFFFSIVYFV